MIECQITSWEAQSWKLEIGVRILPFHTTNDYYRMKGDKVWRWYTGKYNSASTPLRVSVEIDEILTNLVLEQETLKLLCGTYGIEESVLICYSCEEAYTECSRNEVKSCTTTTEHCRCGWLKEDSEKREVK